MKIPAPRIGQFVGKKLLLNSIWALIGLGFGALAGFSLSLREGQSSGALGHVQSQSEAAASAIYVSKNQSYRSAVSLYRTKNPRSPEDRLNFLRTVETWLSQDPADCVNSLREMGSLGMLDRDVIIAAFTDGAESNFTVIARQAGEIQDADLRDAVVRTLFDAVVPSNPEGALELLAHVPVHLRPDFQKSLGRTLGAAADPALFGKLIKHPNAGRDMVIAGLQAWISDKTSDALSFFDSIGEGDLQRMGTSKTYILEKLTSSADPDALLAYTGRQPPSPAIARAITEATGTLLARDPSRWNELVSRQKSDAMISEIAADAAAKVVIKSPDAAAVFLSRISGVDARMQETMQTTRQFYFKGGGTREKVIAWARSIEDPVIAERIIAELRFQGVKLPADFKLR
jgi:hypothetical protein